ncbi:MAG: hypothetical protein ACN6PJ_15940 [Achromobacter sp.]|uniref:hypothetical protein n=1 Tax=Achromobacter sp. TaxID=134375 RepID=UPI003CFE4A04
MPAGLETYGPNGATLVSYTSKIGRQLGSVNTGTSNGSVYLPELAQGIPWIATLSPGGGPFQSTPAIAMSGYTISWTFVEGMPGDRRPIKIVYGVR